MGSKLSKVKVSLASHEDASRFLNLEAMCFGMEPNLDTTYFWTPVVEYLWAYKAEIGRRIVGGMIVMPTRQGHWYVNSLFVHRRYRNRGVASKMLGGFLRSVKSSKVMLDVKTDRPYLLKFYARFGFRREIFLPNYYRDGTDRFLLVRNSGPEAGTRRLRSSVSPKTRVKKRGRTNGDWPNLEPV